MTDRSPAASVSGDERLQGWRAAAERRVFLRDFAVSARIGIYDHEREGPQPLLISATLTLGPESDPDAPLTPPTGADDPARGLLVCYERLSTGVRALAEADHVDYVETLAERIGALCLSDPRVREALVRIEKPQAIPGAAAAGVEAVFRRG